MNKVQTETGSLNKALCKLARLVSKADSVFKGEELDYIEALMNR